MKLKMIHSIYMGHKLGLLRWLSEFFHTADLTSLLQYNLFALESTFRLMNQCKQDLMQGKESVVFSCCLHLSVCQRN